MFNEEILLFTKMETFKKLSQSYFTNLLKKFNLSGLYGKYLIALLDKKPLTQTELSDILNLDKANITRVVNKLLMLNYITKTRANDNRKFLISLTNQGIDVARFLKEDIDNFIKAVTNNIPIEELTTFSNTLNKICDNSIEYLEHV